MSTTTSTANASNRVPRNPLDGQDRVDCRCLVGHWTGCGPGAGRLPVRSGARERPHWRGAAGICARLGVAGRAVGPVQRPAATLGRRAGRRSWPWPACAPLSGSAVVHDVFGWVWPPVLFGLVVWMFLRARRQLRSRVARWLLYPVSPCWCGRGGRRLRDRARVPRRQGLSDARPAGRCRRVPAAPALHRHGQPHGHSGTGSGRGLLGLRAGSRRPWPETAQSASMTAPVGGGATPPTARRTVTRLPRTCTRCLIGRTFPGRTCWPVTRSAASTSSLRREVPRSGRRPGAAGLHRTQTGSGPANRQRIRQRPRTRHLAVFRGRPLRSRTPDRPVVLRHSSAALPG